MKSNTWKYFRIECKLINWTRFGLFFICPIHRWIEWNLGQPTRVANSICPAGISTRASSPACLHISLKFFPLARPKNWTELLPKSISGPKPTQMSNTTTFCLSIMFLSACESQKERAGESERELACESACLAIKFLISALALWARRVTRSLGRGHCWLPPFAAVPTTTTTTSRNKQNIFRCSLFAFNYAIV